MIERQGAESWLYAVQHMRRSAFSIPPIKPQQQFIESANAGRVPPLRMRPCRGFDRPFAMG
jgi:hypothetical protein